MNRIAQVLKLAGILPSSEISTASLESNSRQDLLPDLCEAWHQTRELESDGQQPSSFIAARLTQWRESGAALTIGVPGTDQSAVADWIGNRLALWPDGIPKQRPVGLLSSHLGQELESRSAWFTALRAACTKISAADDILVTSATVTADRFVRRCHELFGIRLLDVLLPKDESWAIRDWGEWVVHENFEAGTSGVARLVLSPELQANTTQPRAEITEPIADRAVIALSQSLIVLSLRRHGRLFPLVERRILDRRWPVASVAVALGTNLVAKDTAEPLLDDGAIGWVLLDTLGKVGGASAVSTGESVRRSHDLSCESAHLAPIIRIPPAERWNFLTHCTRRNDGPWPEQNLEEYLDDLILDRESANHSSFSALMRMLDQHRIVASSAAIRGATPVVSFTAAPLAAIPTMRTFRPHRARWDFEPYGICIHRDWLKSCGARAVTYGDEQTWETLSEHDRPFFQVASTRTNARAIDWTEEDEWRHLGDVDLSLVPDDAALVFVPTEQEASELAEISPWPIVLLPSSPPCVSS